jgi:hypothetical protein
MPAERPTTMPHRLLSSAAMAAIGVLTSAVGPAHADPEKASRRETPAVEQTRQVVERAINFIEKDAAKWRADKKCASCHHGTMTVWALSEAKARGYPIKAETLADMAAWTKERLKDIDKPRDTRPGFSMVNTPALYLAVMAQAVPEQAAVSADELKQVAGHLVRHQEVDGSWAWSAAPAKNRPPPVFESDEVATVMAHLALAPHVPADAKAKSDARDSREGASIWLMKAGRTETTQSLGIRLFRDVRAGVPSADLQPRIEYLLARQNKDGGWGQDKDLPSDAYGTGQALYFLSLAGVKPDRTELQRGVNFLVGTQKEDGSWPMKSRSHPGATPMTNPVPITYFGSAWATMGLVRVVVR